MAVHAQFRLAVNQTVEGRKRGVPERPPGFKDTVGHYGLVSKQAVKLNEKQAERGFQDYIFSPEIVVDKGDHSQ